MTNQQRFEVIKSLAYGMTPEQAAAAVGAEPAAAEEIQRFGVQEIESEKEMLRKAGYLNG